MVVGNRWEMFFSVVVLLGGTLANSHTASPKHFVVVWWSVWERHVTNLLTGLRILWCPTKKTPVLLPLHGTGSKMTDSVEP